MTIKAFWKDIPERVCNDYSQFWALNNVIERDNLWPDEVREAYHAILLETISVSEKNDIHWQVQYLVEEARVPVNTILNFVWLKFSSFEDALDNIIANTEFRRAVNLDQLKGIVSNMDLMWLLDMNVKNLITMETIFNYSIDLSENDTPEIRLRKVEEALLEIQKYMLPGNGLYLNPLVVNTIDNK